MRMKKLFALATIVALIAVGCKKDQLPEPELKLTSQSTMTFTADGGNGTITYKLENADKSTKIAATASDTWISSITTTTAGQVGFTVAANESADARSAKMTVKYGVKSFEVTINQSGKSADDPGVEPDPEPEADVIMAATHVDGFYFGEGEYEFYLSEVGLDDEGYYLPNATYFSFVGLYAAEPAEGAEITVPAGTYTLDLDYTMAEGTFTENSTYFQTNESGSQTGKKFYSEATLVVAEDGSMEFTATAEDGTTFLVTVAAGNYPFVDESTPDLPDVNPDEYDNYLEAPYAMGSYSGNGWGYYDNNLYMIKLHNIENYTTSWPESAGREYQINFFSDTKPTSTPITAPEGVYVFTGEDVDDPGIITPYSNVCDYDDRGFPIVGSTLNFVEATLTITADRIVFDAVDEMGETHYVVFEGDYELENLSGEEIGEDQGVVLDDELEIFAGYYGDYMEIGMGNWYVEVYPADGTGWALWIDAYAPGLGFDPETKFNGTFVNQWSWDYSFNTPFYAGGAFYIENGEETDEEVEFEDGDLHVSPGYFGSTSLVIDDSNYPIELMAVLDWVNESGEGGGEGGGDVDYTQNQDRSFDRIGSAQYYRGGNYFIAFGEFTSDGRMYTNSEYWFLDLYSSVEPTNDDVFEIPVGTYTFDANDTYAPGTFSDYYSYFAWTDNEKTHEFNFTAGTVVVTEQGITAELTLDNGAVHTLTYTGSNQWGEVFDGEIDAAVEPFLGTFTAKFENSLMWQQATGGYAPAAAGTPMEREITIAPYTGSDATGSEVVITGWSINEETFGEPLPMFGRVNATGKLELLAGKTIGSLEDGTSVTWLPIMELSTGGMTAVTGNFVAYTVDPNTMTSTAQSVELTSGETATTFSLDVYGVSSTLSFWQLGPYPAGEFELVATGAAQPAGKAKVARNITSSVKPLGTTRSIRSAAIARPEKELFSMPVVPAQMVKPVVEKRHSAKF